MRTVETRVGLLVLASLALLFYMGVHIGTFRLNGHDYHFYTLFLNSTVGVSTKSDVKIAGVKIGWVESITLSNDQHACVVIMIEKRFKIYNNAQATVQQEGFLGPKYIELLPGDSTYPPLTPGGTLQRGAEPVGMNDLMQQFKTITQNIADITESMKYAMMPEEQSSHSLHNVVHHISATAEKLSSVVDRIDTIMERNQEHIDLTLQAGSHLNEVMHDVEHSVVPQIKQLTESACDGIGYVQSIAQKIDNGTGLVGKLVNDDNLYRDIKLAAEGARTYVNKLERMEIVFDSHFESMFEQAVDFCFKDSKGYFEVRLHTSEDYFYLLQIVSSDRGFLSRSQRAFTYFDPATGCIIDPNALNLSDEAQLRFVFPREKEQFKRNSIRIGFQFCKVFYRYLALRFGLIEGTGGLAVDLDIPLSKNYLRWVTTFEAFDFRGWNRLDDRSPHLKWLNRVFILRNIYIDFGADDFISKHNKSFFLGAGVRFADDDIKYVAALAGGLAAAG